MLELAGSRVVQHADHLQVSTPANPGYHWGNFLLVTDPARVADAGHWVRAFRSAFPHADWLALGLVVAPADDGAWRALGLEVEVDEVLTTTTPPASRPSPDGCVVRRFEGPDWDRSVARAVRDDPGGEDPAAYERFVRRRIATRRALSETDDAAYFGAFDDGELVAELGVVRCGSTARYSNVGTDASHRRRGHASHLLGVAGAWSAERGCDRWVIVTEPTNPAGRVYRRAGFRPDLGNAQVYRGPGR